MSVEFDVTETLDVTGLNCPMPVVKTKGAIDENGTASVEELVELSLDMGVELQACQMTMDLMDYDEDDLHDGVTAGVGPAAALEGRADADIQLLV